MSILVLDIGTSSVRSSVVADDGAVLAVHSVSTLPSRPSPGIVEFDPGAIAEAVASTAAAALARVPTVDSVGISSQRASTVLWDRSTLEPVGPGLGWQDIRTVGRCLALKAQGLRLAPNQSATKLAWLLDRYDPKREADLCFGTIECFVAAVLSGGSLHISDLSNAAVTGLLLEDASGWDPVVLEALAIPDSVLPQLTASFGELGEASSLSGAPVIRALIGDQQASLIGQGCLFVGDAKATFGTGAMLDCSLGLSRPPFAVRGEHGTFPIVAFGDQAAVHWGIEGAMLSAGSCVEWLRDGLHMIGSIDEAEPLARSVPNAGGVVFVPALGGLGTPLWDFGARGSLLGIDPSTSAAHVVYAVLAGIAERGADLLEAVEADAGLSVERLRIDGGMSNNALFVQLLANATGRQIELARTTEATTLGAAFLAGTARGTWSSLEETTATARPRAVIDPTGRTDRERWLTAREHALRAVPALSSLSF